MNRAIDRLPKAFSRLASRFATHWENSHKLVALLLLGLVIRTVAFALSKNYDGDAFWRSVGAAHWIKHPFYIAHANPTTWVFGPLHFYLNGIALVLWDNVRDSPRLVSLITGTLAIIPFFRLVELGFGPVRAWYATLVFCFYTLHVRYSAVAASEAPNSFFLLTAVLLFFRYLSTDRRRYMLASALVFNLTTMLRYENLVFVPILAFASFLQDTPEGWRPHLLFRISRKRLINAGLFCLLSLVFITSRFMGDYVAYGDPIYSLPIGKIAHAGMLQEGLQSRGVLGHYLYVFAFWPGVMFLSVTPIAATLSGLGIVRAVSGRTNLRLVFVFLAVFLLLVYQTAIARTLATFARFSVSYTLFFIPFAGAEWHRLRSSLTHVGARVCDGIVLGSMLAFLACWALFGIEGLGSSIRDKISSISPISRHPVYVEELIRWIDSHVEPGDKVLIDDYRSESDLVVMYSQHPAECFMRRWKDGREVIDYLRERRPRFVVYSPSGRLDAVLPLAGRDSVQHVAGMTFERRFMNRVYLIYEVASP